MARLEAEGCRDAVTIEVLTISSEYESACRLGFRTSTYTGDVYSDSKVIRWGNSEPRPGRWKDFRLVYNPAKAIRLNCDKAKALRAMSRFVETPKLYLKRAETTGHVLIRPVSHSNGDGFRVAQGPVDIPAGSYGTEWIKTKAEVRVFFAWDRMLVTNRVSEKHQNDEFPCRSSWGYGEFGEPEKSLRKAAKEARRAVGLHLGAADILVFYGSAMGNPTFNYIFLELNSAPTVDADEIKDFYVSAIKERLGR